MPTESISLDSVNCFLRKENNLNKRKTSKVTRIFFLRTHNQIPKHWYQQDKLPGFAHCEFSRDQTKIKDTVPSASSH